MLVRRPGHPVVAFDGPGEGGAGGGTTPPAGGGTTPPAGGNTQVVELTAPWAAAGDKPWMLGEAGKEQPWFHAIKEEPVRELMQQKAYSNPAVLATSYFNLNKMVSGSDNVVEIPGPNATQEQKDKFYSKLGRPVDANKYDFNAVWEGERAKNPDFKPNAKLETFARNASFKFGLSNAQAVEMVTEYRKLENELAADAATANKAAEDAALAQLQQKAGGEAQWNANLEAGKRVYKSLGLDDSTTAAIERAMGAAPLLDLLCRIGVASNEAGGFKGGGAGGGSVPGGTTPNTMTPQQAAAEIKRLQGDKDFQAVYTAKNHPGQKEAVERMNALFARAGALAGG